MTGQVATHPAADTSTQQRITTTLLLTACADALAAPFAGVRAPAPSSVDATMREPGPRPAWGPVAQALVLAEHLTDHQGALDEDELAAALARRWAATSNDTQHAGTDQVLADILAGVPRWESARALHTRLGSFGNTAAVRAIPAGLLPHTGIGSVAQLARRAATVTHTHLHARDGAAAVATAVALAAHDHPVTGTDPARFLATVAAQVRSGEFRAVLDLARTLIRHGVGPAEAAATVGDNATALHSVPAALVAFLLHPDNPAEAVRYAILIGGDTTAIAAMTAAMAAARNPHFHIRASWLAAVNEPAINHTAAALANLGGPRR